MFIIRRKLTIETHGIHTTVSFYSVSHSLGHYIVSVFQKLPRLDVRTCQIILDRGIDLLPDKKSIVAIRYKRVRIVLIALYPRRDPCHRGLSVSNCEVRTFDTTKFFEILDALIASSIVTT